MKNLRIILVLLLLLCMATVAFTSCDEPEYVPENDFYEDDGYGDEEEDDVKDHVCIANGNVFENVVESTCTTQGTYDDVYYCAICGDEIVRTPVEAELKEHSYEDGVCTVCGTQKASEGLEIATAYGGKMQVKSIGTCTDEHIVIPSTYDGKPVTIIDANAFQGCDFIKSIEIPEGVTLINNYAFENCTALESATVPNTVRIIGEGAFKNCISLESFEHDLVGGLNTTLKLYDSVFEGCSSLKTVTLSASDLAQGESLGYYVFKGCSSLENVTLPRGITHLSYGIFSGCTELKSVTIPSSVIYINDYAFDGCENLETIYYLGTDWTAVTVAKYGNDALKDAEIIIQENTAVELPMIPA